MGLGPGFDEIAQVLVRLVGQGDPQFQVLVAALAGLGVFQALALEAQGRAAVGAGRNSHGDVAVDGRHGDLGPEQGFLQGHRHLEVDVAVLLAEVGVGLDLDRDDGIAGRAAARPRRALALEAKRLAVLGAGRDTHLEDLAPARADPLLAALGRLDERNRHLGAQVLALGPGLAGARAAAAEDLGKEILGPEIRAEGAAARAAARAATARAAGVSTAGETAFLAVGVDLAAIEPLALSRVAQQGIGLGDLLEALFHLACRPDWRRGGVSSPACGRRF